MRNSPNNDNGDSFPIKPVIIRYNQIDLKHAGNIMGTFAWHCSLTEVQKTEEKKKRNV